ncbi:MAG TPA: FtsX-like permease family protein, partial [Chloroflexi bacterium]|nr:FtsX-like permease family protein [Chloroflexota bacterium]
MQWLWCKAYRDVLRRPLRTLLTTLGILVGVGGIVAIATTAQGLPQAQEAAFHHSSYASITVWVHDAPARLKRGIENIPNVKAAELRNTYYTRWSLGNTWRDVYFIGVPDFTQMEVNKLTLLEGRFPGPDECVVEVSAAEFFGIEPGQRITYRAGGREREITVVGTVRSPAFLSASIINVAIAYAPSSTVRKMREAEGFNRLLVLLNEPRFARETARRIDRYLTKVNIPHTSPHINDPENYPGRREFYALAMVLSLFSALGLTLSGFLVTNTIAAIVIESVREIGVLKALGARKIQVMGLYLAMALLYAIPGTLLGTGAGTVVGYVLSRRIGELANVPVPFRFSPQAAAMGVAVGIAVTLAAGLIPAWRGASIPPHEALSTYGIVSAYGRSLLERALMRLKALPPLWLMALRNLTRRRLRNGITILAIAVSIAAYIAARGTDASVNRAIEELFQIYAADAWVYFTRPVLPQFTHRLESLPVVSTAEAWSLDDAWVSLTQVRLWGLPP